MRVKTIYKQKKDIKIRKEKGDKEIKKDSTMLKSVKKRNMKLF